MAEYRFCYGCRNSLYVENRGFVPNHQRVCLYCEVKHKYIAKDNMSNPICFQPEDKNNPAYHIVRPERGKRSNTRTSPKGYRTVTERSPKD